MPTSPALSQRLGHYFLHTWHKSQAVHHLLHTITSRHPLLTCKSYDIWFNHDVYSNSHSSFLSHHHPLYKCCSGATAQVVVLLNFDCYTVLCQLNIMNWLRLHVPHLINDHKNKESEQMIPAVIFNKKKELSIYKRLPHTEWRKGYLLHTCSRRKGVSILNGLACHTSQYANAFTNQGKVKNPIVITQMWPRSFLVHCRWLILLNRRQIPCSTMHKTPCKVKKKHCCPIRCFPYPSTPDSQSAMYSCIRPETKNTEIVAATIATRGAVPFFFLSFWSLIP